MRDKLNQFISNLNGQFVEVSSEAYRYQCMDLAYLWVFCLGIPKATIQHLNASEAYTKAGDICREYFDLIPNTPEAVPQAGDLVVWKGTVGHIAIAIEGDTNSFMCFEQNKPLGTNAHIQTEKYTNVIGFLRPKNIPQIPDPKIIELQGQVAQWQAHFDDIKEHLRLAGVMPGDDLPKIIGVIDGLIANQPEEGEQIINIPKNYTKLFRIGDIEVGLVREVK